MGSYRLPVASLRVLVVEDEILIAMELQDLLENGGYDVVGPATTIAAALAMLDRYHPNACILDVNLRGENSAPVARALKALDVPFLLSSAYERDVLDRHGAFAEVVNIGKPAPPAKLMAALALLLQT